MRISYSALDTYQNCSLKYKFQNIDKIKEPKSKEAVFGTLIHSTLKFIHTPALLQPKLEEALDFFSKNWNADVFENEMEERASFSQGVAIIQDYYKKNNPADSNIVDLESRFAIEIADPQKNTTHIVSGIIDRIDKTEDGYEIIDYKTTKKMPSQEKVDNDLQLSVYLNAFLSRYPKEAERLDKITVSLYYLKHGVKLSSTRTKEQLQSANKIFLDVASAIEEGKFEPNVTPLCDWCGYQKLCPMWKHKFKEERKIDTEEVNAAIEEYINIKAAITTTKTRIAELQEKIIDYMQQEGVDRVFSEEGIIAESIRKTYKYDEKKLREILEPLDKWEDVLKVDSIALKNILPVLSLAARKEIDSAKVLDKETRSLTVKKK
ncbi:MAG TPA: PD-(D/E)XK nuclease family protein [Candidatus Moranbacteria bacterium]|nr:PD-(D/E)XK nuclease family protein [Candidatus Moranbacteria bacterium]HRY27778.1 PD-(D/E)XK nuclease family protein [Candidatus Moranbacteria bacterium]HSA08143.1 PD-(D/E)XK nuclease family protein [Candidatus Moranbacteria bacterium]